MTGDLVIVGCGGFGREVVGIVDAINNAGASSKRWNLVGFIDDAPNAADIDRVESLGFAILGPLDASFIPPCSETYFVVGIGSGSIRRNVTQRAETAGLTAAVLVHPSASIGRDVRIGIGSIVAGQAQVTTNVVLGEHVHIDRGVQVGHDSRIGDFSTLHPAAVVSGGCRIGDEVELGTHCTILPGLTVASNAAVGAAACVVKDVPPAMTVKGVPAR